MSTLTLTFQNLQVNVCLICKLASLPACCLDLSNFFITCFYHYLIFKRQDLLFSLLKLNEITVVISLTLLKFLFIETKLRY